MSISLCMHWCFCCHDYKLPASNVLCTTASPPPPHTHTHTHIPLQDMLWSMCGILSQSHLVCPRRCLPYRICVPRISCLVNLLTKETVQRWELKECRGEQVRECRWWSAWVRGLGSAGLEVMESMGEGVQVMECMGKGGRGEGSAGG